MAKSATLFVRIKPEIRQLIDEHAKGPKSLGSFVSAAVESYIKRDEHLVSIVLDVLAKSGKSA